MEREKKSSEELHQILQLHLDELGVEYGEPIIALGVYYHLPDISGCNWNTKGFLGSRRHAPRVTAIVSELRALYSLSD